ncbi:hypothetical protein, partial [Pseudovibrio sp. Ad37]|uniref:hypothetical protein n=1 Tax=Pseudovibrio sp. Ad37 TaxID=989422 RepID=UPI0019D36FEE
FWLKSLITRSPASTISCRGVTLLSQRNRAYFRFVGRVRRTHTEHRSLGLVDRAGLCCLLASYEADEGAVSVSWLTDRRIF